MFGLVQALLCGFSTLFLVFFFFFFFRYRAGPLVGVVALL
jgi:hypothetical protein